MDKAITQDDGFKRMAEETAAYRNRQVAGSALKVPRLEHRTPWFAGCIAPVHVACHWPMQWRGVLR